ncbi:hypothetical protein JW968_06800, partial [Candidatus Woesearchaeota archaeon]|nr:hypothetical protein [Candidatus Woesearchaeota archaeon]
RSKQPTLMSGEISWFGIGNDSPNDGGIKPLKMTSVIFNNIFWFTKDHRQSTPILSMQKFFHKNIYKTLSSK